MSHGALRAGKIRANPQGRVFHPTRPNLAIIIPSDGPNMPAATSIVQLPKMAPPKGELPPPAWETYGWPGALAIAAIVLFVVFMARKRVAAPTPAPAPDTIVRQRLAALPIRPATPGDALEIARSLREYFIATFFIPCDAMTTEEPLPLLHRQRGLTPELLADTENILRDCDHIAFSAAPHRDEPTPMVERAKALVERCLVAQRALQQTRTPVTAGPANP